jgi:hypothetical protein
MGTLAVNVDLITGWFPLTEIIVAVALVVLSVGWHDFPGSRRIGTRAGYADSTSTTFAKFHDGTAPILVIPDNNGNAQDTEC